MASMSVLAWVYRYVTGHHPEGADNLEQAHTGKVSDIRDKDYDKFGAPRKPLEFNIEIS